MEKEEIIILYKYDKIGVANSERRLKIYKDLLKYLNEEEWEAGKPLQYYIVEFKGKKGVLIVPYS